MHIVMLSPDFARAGRARAGYVGRLAEGLADAGHRVTVVTCALDGSVTDERIGGAHVIGVPEPLPIVPADEPLGQALQFASVALAAATDSMIERPADLVHAHDWPMAWPAVALKRTWAIPLIAAVHAPASAPVAREAERWLVTEAASVLVRSRTRAAGLAQWLPSRRIVVVPDGAGLAARTAAAYDRAR